MCLCVCVCVGVCRCVCVSVGVGVGVGVKTARGRKGKPTNLKEDWTEKLYGLFSHQFYSIRSLQTVSQYSDVSSDTTS